MLETGYQAYTRAADDPERVAGSVGRPASHMGLRVVDPEGHDVAPGEAGDICCDGPSVHLGYHDNAAANAEVFLPDGWFRSGDMMRQDADGRVFFVDRLGDTFRWRSENVSTNEVADVIGSFPEIDECNVYGVSVPNADGRCGCAAIVLSTGVSPDTLDLAGLAQYATERLPRYAVPLFLRTKSALSYTGTFKIQKGQAKREGVDPAVISEVASQDRLFWLPPGAKAYEPFNSEHWQSLKSGTVKL